MFDNFFGPEMVQALIYIGATFVTLFTKAFLDAVKPGKPDGRTQQLALWFIRKIINKISPEELGRKVALKINPDSPNARRVSDNKPFTKEHAIRFNRGVVEAKYGHGGWDF